MHFRAAINMPSECFWRVHKKAWTCLTCHTPRFGKLTRWDIAKTLNNILKACISTSVLIFILAELETAVPQAHTHIQRERSIVCWVTVGWVLRSGFGSPWKPGHLPEIPERTLGLGQSEQATCSFVWVFSCCGPWRKHQPEGPWDCQKWLCCLSKKTGEQVELVFFGFLH